MCELALWAASHNIMTNKMPLLLLRYRLWFIAVFQGCLIICSLVAAWLLRFDFTLAYRSTLLAAIPILLVTRLAAVAYFGLLRGWLSEVGFRDVVDLLKTCGTGSALFLDF